MTSCKITAAVVVYNKEIGESVTYQSIRDIDDNIDILVLDNSETINDNKDFCAKHEIRYISMEGNKGLSKAYNMAVDNSIDADVIILLDDDTEVSDMYFEKLKVALVNNPDTDIFAPIIRGQDGIIYSPNEFSFLRNHFIKTPKEKVSQHSFNAIASCLAIRMRVFNNYRFNEKLFVDQVDQYFFCEQRELGRKFGQIDVEILQHFYQRDSFLTPEIGWRRLRLRIIDIFRHARLMGRAKYLPLAFIKCCGLGVQIGKKSNSFEIVFKAAVLSCRLLFIDV